MQIGSQIFYFRRVNTKMLPNAFVNMNFKFRKDSKL